MVYKFALKTTLLLFLLGVVVAAQETRTYSRADFVNVEGGSLNDKIGRAVQQFKGTKAGETVWLAYHFPARDGISIGPFSGMVYRDDDGVRLERRDDPQGAAIFLLADTSGSKTAYTRVKTLNLNEPYLFENRPVYWLGNVTADESIQQLESIMRESPDDKTIARSILRAVGVHQSPRAVPLLKEAAQKEPGTELQRAAIGSLARIGSKESLDALDDLFAKADTTSLKREIVRSYSYAGERANEKRVLDKLSAVARSEESPEVRAEAIRRIASFRGEAISDRLFELYDRADRQLKIEILNRVTPTGARNDRIAPRLISIAKTETDVELQRAAVRRLGVNRETEQVDALINIYETVNVDAVKEEVIARLGRSEQKRALDKLMSIAKSDANPKLRQAAIRRLSSNRQAFSLN
jgi:HEAT repeat protein